MDKRTFNNIDHMRKMTSNAKKKDIAIVWANPYNGNLGVSALAYSALALLYDVLKENKIDANLTFLGSSKCGSDHITVNKTVIAFDNLYGMDFFEFKSRLKLLFFPRKFQKRKILNFDFIFDIAEGDSFTDLYGDERFRRILNSKKFFAKLQKPQVLLPQTIGPFKNPSAERAAFAVMSRLNKIISRDRQSYDYTARFLPKEKIAEAIDVAFYMPFEKMVFENGRVKVGINVSGLLWNGGYTRNNQFGLKSDYKKLILNTLAYFTEQDVEIHLISHVIPTDHAVEDDFAAAEELKLLFPEVKLSPRFKDPIAAKSYISGMDFFTGARMHACIAAFSTGVPVFPMAYSRKFNGLFGATLNYKWMGDCVNEEEDVVFDSLKNAFKDRDRLKAEITHVSSTVVKPRLQLLKELLAETLKS